MKLTLGLTVLAFAATAGSPCMAQSLPPVRQLGPVTAVAKEPLGAVSTVRHLPDGRLLVNDILGRRIVMFDSTLSTATVIADTTSATAGAYGIRPGGLIAYRGDSTLFVEGHQALQVRRLPPRQLCTTQRAFRPDGLALLNRACN